MIAVPSHRDVLLRQAARAMRRPVDIDRADSLDSNLELDPLCTPYSYQFSPVLTTVIVGWCFFAELSAAMRFTKDYHWKDSISLKHDGMAVQ